MLLFFTSGDKFMLLILPPGEKLILQDQVFGRIAYGSLFGGRVAYALLFGPRAVSLCFSFCVRAVSLFIIQDKASGRIAYGSLFGLRAVSILLILCSGGKLIIQDQVCGHVAYYVLFGLRAVKFMLLNLPSDGKLIMSERIVYGPLFGLRSFLFSH